MFVEATVKISPTWPYKFHLDDLPILSKYSFESLLVPCTTPMNFQTPNKNRCRIDSVAYADIGVLVTWPCVPPWSCFRPLRSRWYGEGIIEVEGTANMRFHSPGAPRGKRRSKVLNESGALLINRTWRR
jgi:hypothetical protein